MCSKNLINNINAIKTLKGMLMKKLLILCFFLLLLFYGCANNTHDVELSDIFVPETKAVNDNTYLVFPENVLKKVREQSFIVDVAYIDIESLADLKHLLQTRTFTIRQIAIMDSAFMKDKHGVKVCDFNNLYEPILPEGFSVLGLTWSGSYYAFSIDSGGDLSGSFFYIPHDQYTSFFKQNYEESFNSPLIFDFDETDIVVDGVNAKAITYKSEVSSIKNIRYTIE